MKKIRSVPALLVLLSLLAVAPRSEAASRGAVVCASVLVFVGAFTSRQMAVAEYERVQREGEAELVALPFRALLQGERGMARSLDRIVLAEITEPPNLLPQHLLMGGSAVAAIAALAFPRRKDDAEDAW